MYHYQEQRTLITYPAAKVLTIAVNLLATTLAPAQAAPFKSNEWPNPSIKKSIITTIATSPQGDATSPNFSIEWKNPTPNLRKFPTLTFLNNSQQTTLVPAAPSPFVPISWNNPLLKEVPTLTWIQTRPEYYVDNQPHNQKNWPNPILAKKLAPTWIYDRRLTDTVGAVPFVPINYPNPLIKVKIRTDWQQSRPSHFVEPEPFVPVSYPNPLVKARIRTDWQWARPSYYIEADLIITQTNWPIPLRKRVYPIIYNYKKFEPSVDPGPPFRQRDWPNPVRRHKIVTPWLDYYIFDESAPPPSLYPGVQSFDLPRRKKPFVPTWIYGGQLSGVADARPIKTFDWPNPRIVKKQNVGFAVNLIQTPFNIQPGAKPFFENKWPNPLIGAANFHIGWIEGRKFYSTEPSLQIRQNNWPVFRALRRNPVGWIDFKIGTSEPKFTSITSVPLRKRVLSLTWLDNPLVVINAIAGDLPFNQHNWPIFVRIRRASNLITFISFNPFIPPDSTGREVCVLASLETFDLLASIDPLEVDARLEIFDLEAGGDKCE